MKEKGSHLSSQWIVLHKRSFNPNKGDIGAILYKNFVRSYQLLLKKKKGREISLGYWKKFVLHSVEWNFFIRLKCYQPRFVPLLSSICSFAVISFSVYSRKNIIRSVGQSNFFKNIDSIYIIALALSSNFHGRASKPQLLFVAFCLQNLTMYMSSFSFKTCRSARTKLIWWFPYLEKHFG